MNKSVYQITHTASCPEFMILSTNNAKEQNSVESEAAAFVYILLNSVSNSVYDKVVEMLRLYERNGLSLLVIEQKAKGCKVL